MPQGMGDLLEMTCGDVLHAQAAQHPDKPFVIIASDGSVLSYSDVERESAAVAKALLASGIRRGDTVMTWLPNRAEFILFALGAARVGVLNALANTRYQARELAHAIDISEPRLLLFEKEFFGRRFDDLLHDALSMVSASAWDGRSAGLREQLVCMSGDEGGRYVSWSEFLDRGRDIDDATLAAAEAEVVPTDHLYVIYTSGTTGHPKGSVSRQSASLKNSFDAGEAEGATADSRLLMFLPLFHCFGAVRALFNVLTHGSTMVLQTEFVPKESLSLISTQRITHVYGVPTNMIMLAEAYRGNEDLYSLESWRGGLVGGGEVGAELMHALDVELKIPQISAGYGMTECTAVIAQPRFDQPSGERYRTVGRPLPGVELKIVDQIDPSVEVGDGEVGDILIRGYSVHAGYQNSSDDGCDADGWFKTGDLGCFTDGLLSIIGRSKDMYKSSGFNVYPLEIETQLNKHPAIAESAVVGVPDPLRLEVGVAYVSLRSGEQVTEQEVLDFIRPHFAKFKIPERVIFIEELPRSFATLKVQKHTLRSSYQESVRA